MIEMKKEKMSVLAIGAHPDDLEWGCGGTLAVLKMKGNDVYALVLTDGENDNGERASESMKSANMLGLDDIFLAHLPMKEVSDNRENVNIIERYIKEVEPSLVFSMTRKERHQDHRYCGSAAISASRNVPNLLLYESDCSEGFEPNMYVDISGTINSKLDALSNHATQIKNGRITVEDARNLARYRASQLRRVDRNIEYAEAFQIYRMVGIPDFGCLRT